MRFLSSFGSQIVKMFGSIYVCIQKKKKKEHFKYKSICIMLDLFSLERFAAWSAFQAWKVSTVLLSLAVVPFKD